ncbi:hypothetical protein QYF61_004216 [Mycteria americana]|uniref:Uncharacterized protein n=1 Tax=Mycteria americana TaxID=33587 RepID=A0AAN7PBF0_MYCAM|nr:hypothetical protein QYF61_004216 [Mycteria americana]
MVGLDDLKGHPHKFPEDAKLSGVNNTAHGCAAIQRLEKWADRNLRKFNKGKCKVLYLVRNNPMHKARLSAHQLETSLAEKDFGVLVDNKLTTSKQCALGAKKSNSLLDSIRQSTASRSREMILLFYSALMRHYKRNMDILEQVRQRATKTIKGLKHLSYEERLRELGLFSLKKRRLQEESYQCV